MAGVNKVILVGNLGKDPEVRHGPDGSKIVNFTLATNETWKDKNSGERREKTEWHRVVIFNDKIGDVVEKYLKKGSKIYLEGQLQTRKWTDQQGQEKYTTEVVMQRYRGELTMLDGKSSGSNGADDYGAGGGYDSYASSGANGGSQSGGFDGPLSSGPLGGALNNGSSSGGFSSAGSLNDDVPF